MDGISVILQDAYGRLQLGALPSKDFRELASVINASISSPSVPKTHSETCNKADERVLTAKEIICQSHGNRALQFMLLSLTLVEKMSVKLLDQELPQVLRLYIQNLFRVLQEELRFIPSIFVHFGSKDRMLSHLAAKCLSSLLICELQSLDAYGMVMQNMCDETFQMHSSCCRWEAGLWSLTAVIKEMLKRNNEHKSEQIAKLLTRIDPGVTSLYSWLLQSQDTRTTGDRGTTLTTFMDLLEALTAARFRLGTCVSSQRLLFTQTPALLQLLESGSQYFVKRHVLLLLKKTVLQRAGEDWLMGAVSSESHRDPYLAEDMGTLTEAVLQQVNCGWLRHVPVRDRPSFFGGATELSSAGRADDVMLRAVSMVLLKSLEYQSQSGHSKSDSQAIHTSRHLKELLLFLSQHCVQLRQSHHPCLCVSVVFGDQDDDMIEAARALLILHTHQKSLGASSEAGCCEMGSNPHCHFVLLLRGLAFDHSVLLDFLISSETCFLEYVVRYLKLLRDDWGGFCRSCQLLEAQDVQRCSKWRENSGHVSPLLDRSAVSEAGESHSSDKWIDVCTGLSQACPRLVDYGSSDESAEEEEEEMDMCVGSPDTGQRPAAGSLNKDGGQKCISLPDCKQSLEQSNESIAVVKRTQTLVQKVVHCLMELKAVITRLQRKNLFPYNPVSLVKLLTVIEEKSGSFC
ncbi:hypothetical protein ACEWY4_015898 [Coilia grayii]|uniref:Lines homolog 1 n=1 Tax=Coilia grayii TaxID=363190 RepID=A0ABD1JQ73_9TELE